MKLEFKKLQCLSATALKLIAIASMLIDHIGAVLFPGAMWLRIVGRLAMPIFCFFVSEGFIHTRSKRRYLVRMLIFAVVSDIPFDLAFWGKLTIAHQNVMFTFAFAVAAMWIYEALRKSEKAILKALGVLSVFILAALSTVCGTDYGYFGVLMVFVFYVLRDFSHWIRSAAASAYILILRMDIEVYAALSFFLLLLYNGKRGKGLKWFFYVFYPAHLLILYAIAQVI